MSKQTYVLNNVSWKFEFHFGAKQYFFRIIRIPFCAPARHRAWERWICTPLCFRDGEELEMFADAGAVFDSSFSTYRLSQLVFDNSCKNVKEIVDIKIKLYCQALSLFWLYDSCFLLASNKLFTLAYDHSGWSTIGSQLEGAHRKLLKITLKTSMII